MTTISDIANPRYIGKRRNEVPPHLFAASDGAYAQMMNNTKDQVKQIKLSTTFIAAYYPDDYDYIPNGIQLFILSPC